MQFCEDEDDGAEGGNEEEMDGLGCMLVRWWDRIGTGSGLWIFFWWEWLGPRWPWCPGPLGRNRGRPGPLRIVDPVLPGIGPREPSGPKGPTVLGPSPSAGPALRGTPATGTKKSSHVIPSNFSAILNNFDFPG